MELKPELITIGEQAKQASRLLMPAGTATKNAALQNIADTLQEHAQEILDANAIDMANAEAKGLRKSLLTRLLLTPKQIDGICEGVRDVIQLPDPVGRGEMWTRPNGLRIEKISAPLGVIGIIYEARPNVTVDAAALCLKSGNACLLRGGSEAAESNKILVRLIAEAIAAAGLPAAAVQLVPAGNRAYAEQLMRMNSYVDVIIPRGGAGLIQSVVANATVPVIETGAGVCHTYVHDEADLDKALSIVYNAKTDKPGVCNALETLLVDEAVAAEFLPRLAHMLTNGDKGPVEMRACPKTLVHIPDARPATAEDWQTEHNDMILNMKTVAGREEALDHIYQNSTKHSEAILTESYPAAQRFLKEVDAAAVYVNASIRFTDGNRFGFGAEIGISTQKLHARGPMGLPELTTCKYLVYGEGQIVN
ncbi:MAG: glutamate-5-semialdehyde dehydrogenase [Gracilibacteraceae bacterium]|jgi:glutamate-5-semialdehyde dehydrogenase|nr:glutamate-5-semialdehyde dehydrogenase [Gracilibacteraceae bacterium]